MTEISGKFAKGRLRDIFKKLEIHVNYSPRITELRVRKRDYLELITLSDGHAAICYKGRKIISVGN